MPSSWATARVAPSTAPPPPGAGGTRTTIRGTPATTAGVPIWQRTDGYDALPVGTNRPTLGIGPNCSPTRKPGRTSCRQPPAVSASCASLNRRLFAIASRIPASNPGASAAWAAARSATGTRSSAPDENDTPSNFVVAARTASSPRSATSRKIASIEAIRLGSKIWAVERARRRWRSSGSRLDQRRTARMPMTGGYPTPPATA